MHCLGHIHITEVEKHPEVGMFWGHLEALALATGCGLIRETSREVFNRILLFQDFVLLSFLRKTNHKGQGQGQDPPSACGGSDGCACGEFSLSLELSGFQSLPRE